MRYREKIAITGMGLVTPLGLTAGEAWERCRAGQSGIADCQRFDTSGHACRSAAQVPAYQLENLRAPKNQKFMNPGARHLVRAAQEAISGAAVQLNAVDPLRVSLHVGSGRVGPEPKEFFRAFDLAHQADGSPDWDQMGGRASRLLDPYFPLRALSNSGTALLAMEIGARGPSSNFVQFDVASALALDAACRDLEDSRCDVALAGGFDCLLTPACYLSFEKQGLLSAQPPEDALRPFDSDADGIVLGEGAAAVVLERLQDARRRGAPVLAEIAGFSTSVVPCDADFVVASGLGVPVADRKEAATLSGILGNRIPVTAFKGLTGYLGAATALVEIVLGVMALQHRLIPPVAHHRRSAPGIDLQIVSEAILLSDARPSSAVFVSNSWAGQSAAVHVAQAF